MANGTLAASQLEMLSQSGTGVMTIVPPATNTNQTLTLPDSTGTVSTLGVGTAVASTSGTSIDFTGIPSWVKRITVMFGGVSTNGSSNYQIQIGSGSVATSGYASTCTRTAGTALQTTTATSGFLINTANANNALNGIYIITLLNGFTYVEQGNGSDATNAANYISAGAATISGTLDRVRITTVNGTDTFDAGTINIIYEG